MKVLFSSWNGKVIDNRGKQPSSWDDAPGLKLPSDFDNQNKITGFMGWDGIIITEEPYNILSMCKRYMQAIQKESCGRCFPCRIGTAVLLKHLEQIVDGKGSESDLEALESLGKNISETSRCSIGVTGPIPILHALKHFKKEFTNAVHSKKKIESSIRYESKWTAPCYSACPSKMDIPTYIGLIKEGDYLGSLNNIRTASPMASCLGRACFHPCERSCRRENVEEAISICRLKRFAWDYVDQHNIEKWENPNKNTKKEKVAIIGAGPAGLSAAYYLALEGYPVTIFEKLLVPGGMAAVGIPEYRVTKYSLDRETEYVTAMGVEIKYGVDVGKDITIEEIKAQGYKAFLIVNGGHLSKKMGVEDEDVGIKGVEKGVEFLRKFVVDGVNEVKGKRVVVVGGGNTAMDCSRSPIRMGAKEVTVAYRRTKKELPADPEEVHDSEVEGVKYQFLVAPTRVISEDGNVTGLECLKMELGPPDDSGRRRPVPIKGSEFVLSCDVIISAIGQDCDLSLLDGIEGLKFTRWKTIIADPETFQSDVDWIFTAGDVYNGPLTLVSATGDARRVAKTIGQYLRGEKPSLSIEEKMDKVMNKLGVYQKAEEVPVKGGWERLPMPHIDLDLRKKGFTEVQTGYTLKTATEEAARCMRCYQVGMVSLGNK